MMKKPIKEKKKEENDNIGVQVRPERTEESKKNYKKSLKMRTTLIGFFSFAYVVASFLVVHYYFQLGWPIDKVNSLTINALYLTFGKMFFVVTVMAMLIAISQTYKSFSKTIGNNCVIQLIGN